MKAVVSGKFFLIVDFERRVSSAKEGKEEQREDHSRSNHQRCGGANKKILFSESQKSPAVLKVLTRQAML